MPEVGETLILEAMVSVCQQREAFAAMDYFTVPTLTVGWSTANSSSGITGVAFSTATYPGIPRGLGSSSNCARRSRLTWPKELDN
jgi:hypothetical protein